MPNNSSDINHSYYHYIQEVDSFRRASEQRDSSEDHIENEYFVPTVHSPRELTVSCDFVVCL